MSKKAYIVLTHFHRPNPEAESAKDAWKIEETCEFVNSIKPRMHTDATAIVDYTNRKIVKNRVADATYAAFMEYVETTYPEKFEEFKTVVRKMNEAKTDID